jgi:hypothetical protein
MIHDPPEHPNSSDDISQEAVAARKRRSRLNAVILALVFLVYSYGPPRWKLFAPLLFLLPVLYSLLSRLRGASIESDRPVTREIDAEPPVAEPYSYTPRDPNDPRRYKPIE